MKYEIENFNADVIERSFTIPVLVDFWAEWCGPCKVLGPILERLAGKNKEKWALAKLDTDTNQEIAAQYGIRSIPNVKLFVDGVVTSEFTGALPEHAVAKWLEKAVPSRFRKEIEKAEELIAQSGMTDARTVLEEVLTHDPQNEHARVLLAKSYLNSDVYQAEKIVAGIEEHSKHYSDVEAITTIASVQRKREQPDSLPDDPVKKTYLDAIESFSRGDFDRSLMEFIAVIRENRYYDDDGSRKACLAIFRILGEDHEITGRHRRDFGSALNV